MKILFVMHPNTSLSYDNKALMSYFVEEDLKVYFLSSFIGHEGMNRDVLLQSKNFRVSTFPNFYIGRFDRFTVYKVIRNLLVQMIMLVKTAYLSIRYNIDVFITLGGFVESGFAPLICSKILKKPLIVRVAGAPSRDVFIRVKSPVIYGLYRKTEEIILKEASKIIFLDAADEKYKDKALVIPQKVDTHVFRRLKIKEKYEQYGIEESDFILLYVGRITREKGVKTLVESFPAIKSKVPNSKLLLVGKGNLEGYIKSFIETSDLKGNIQLLGEKNRNELSRLYNIAGVTILLSMSEGTPNVILESLACGTPVIATRVGNVSRIIEDGKNGFLVNPEPEEIANAVVKIQELNGRDLNKIVEERNKNYEEGMKILMREISGLIRH